MPGDFGRGEKQSSGNSVAGPASYDPSSKPSVTLDGVISISDESEVNVKVSGGYDGEVASTQGNVVNVKVNALPDTISGGLSSLTEVNSGVDLSAETISVNGRGY